MPGLPNSDHPPTSLATAQFDPKPSFAARSTRSDSGRKQTGDSGGSSANSGHWLNDGHAAQFCSSGHSS
jgi:hypothetical protein